MKTKILKSSISAFGAIILCFATGACTKTQDGTADTSSSGSSGSVAGNDAANTGAGSGAAGSDAAGTAGSTASNPSASGDLSAVNPNPPVSAVEVALMGDPSLSSAAKNIQVSADNNKLVLRGSVPSNELKNQIEEKAKEVARGVQIDNQITVSGQQ